MIKRIPYLLVAILLITACEKEIKIDLPPAPQEIVVEAYINDWSPLMNYVILTHTVDYFNPDLSLPAVSGAQVEISEGTVNGSDTSWAFPVVLPELAADTLPGVYFNPLLNGEAGKVYRLEAWVDGKYLHSITTIPEPVSIDSVEVDVHLEQDSFGYLTVFFYDPPARGNNYRMIFRYQPDSVIALWGSINESDALRDDEFINGETWDFRYTRRFDYGDTLQYFLNSIDRNTYLFWDSYFDLRGNSGNPFATPVKLQSNIQGGIGCFTGYGVSYRQIIIR